MPSSTHNTSVKVVHAGKRRRDSDASAASTDAPVAQEERRAKAIARLQLKLTHALSRGDEARADAVRARLAKRGALSAATEAAAAAGDELHLETELHGEHGSAAAAAAAIPEPSAEYSTRPAGNVSLLLFYAYVVPPWTPRERAYAIDYTYNVLHENGCTGRLRVALEGFNCTMTGPAEGLRAFVAALQAWDPARHGFDKTDFKLVDGLAANKAFKGLKVWPVAELVNYGFKPGQGQLEHGGTHVTPSAWVELLQQPGGVLIDVRNANETAIGRFIPPAGGAALMDPHMRRSTEFPGWVAANLPTLKSAQRVMMVCTAGVRCERASAFVAEMGVPRDRIMQLEGGIHRFLDAFPEDGAGGLWAGRNYTFDKRFSHGSEKQAVVVGRCACCHGEWERYQAQAKCSRCRMETLLCRTCERSGRSKGVRLLCWLCEEALAKGDAADAKRAAAYARSGGGRDGEGEGAAAAGDE